MRVEVVSRPSGGEAELESLAELVLPLPEAPPKNHPVEVCFQAEPDGRLEVSVRDPSTDRRVEERVADCGSTLDARLAAEYARVQSFRVNA